MIAKEWKKTVQTLCPDVEKKAIDEFAGRMDEDYFESFPLEEICAHIRMAARLRSKDSIQVEISPRPAAAGEFNIVIVGFDYLSEFSIFCGLLSAFGLDIQAGDIYSFGNEASFKTPRKIVDVFHVRAGSDTSFDEVKQETFVTAVRRFAHLLATGDIQEPREQLNRFLVESIEKMDEPLSGLLSPVEIKFDNDASQEWTVMEAHAKDAFAFLYAVSNALAMRGVYIHKVKIRGSGAEVKDQFFIANRWRKKIESAREQERLGVAISMMKEFTSFLPEAPDPAKAMRHFDQFVDKLAEARFPDHVISFLAKKEGMNVLAHLLGSSDYLWDDFLGIHFHDLIPVLEDLENTPLQPDPGRLRRRLEQAAGPDEKRRALNQFKDAELFRIDAKHLLEPAVTLEEFSLALTDLAEIVLTEAANLCHQESGGGHTRRQPREFPEGSFTICGLGKFGGREVGYASDLELLFVHESEAETAFFEMLVRRITECIETRKTGIFHIDLRLRPYGDAGLWSVPFDRFVSYYSASGNAAPFERQALIKLRHVAGDAALGRRVEAHRDAFTYSGARWDSEDALHLRRRQMKELVKPGEVNVKYSPGGIVDIEYSVQYLQLLHGHRYPALRATNTLEALHRLRDLQIMTEAEHAELHSAYLFLRNVIDALRIVHGDASHLVLPPQGSEEFKSLARRLGYREKDRSKSAVLLAADLQQKMSRIHHQALARYDK